MHNGYRPKLELPCLNWDDSKYTIYCYMLHGVPGWWITGYNEVMADILNPGRNDSANAILYSYNSVFKIHGLEVS